MQKYCFLVVLFVFCISNHLASAKPVMETSFETACREAPIIVVAKVVKHQYESIKDGETITVDQFSLWQEYEVVDILKNTAGAESISINTIIRLADKSNSCIRYETKVLRKEDKLEIAHLQNSENPRKELLAIADLKKNNGKKVILFLSSLKNENKDVVLLAPKGHSHQQYDFAHFGWFVSPAEYSTTKAQEITNIIKNQFCDQ